MRNKVLWVLFSGIFLLFPRLMISQIPPQASSSNISPLEIEKELDSALVTLDGETILRVMGYTAVPAAERAGKIEERLRNLANTPSIPLNSITVREDKNFSEFSAGDQFLFILTEKDAELERVPRAILVKGTLTKLQTVLEHYRSDRTPKHLIQSALYAGLATILYLVLLWIFLKILRKFLGWLNQKIGFISIKTHQIVRLEWLLKALVLLGRFIRVIVVIWLSIFYLQQLLSFFPWSRPYANQLLDYLITPLRSVGSGFLNQLPNLLFLTVLVFATYLIIKLIKFIFMEIEQGKAVIPGFYPEWAHPTYNITRTLVIAFAAIISFPYLPGSSSPAFQGVSIFLGLLLSLGSSSAVANVVAGVILTYMRSYRVGDFIQVGDSRGTVTDTSLLVTRIKTIKEVDVTVPNSIILGAHINNYSKAARQKNLWLHTTVTIGYDAPWRQVEALLLLAAERTPGILRDPAPLVLQTALNDFYVSYELDVITDAPEIMHLTYSTLHANIQDAFNEYGVQIMSPNYMMDRAQPPIVPRDRWFEPPARPPQKKEEK
jgi:small-conductance mechanosensitive channel